MAYGSEVWKSEIKVLAGPCSPDISGARLRGWVLPRLFLVSGSLLATMEGRPWAPLACGAALQSLPWSSQDTCVSISVPFFYKGTSQIGLRLNVMVSSLLDCIFKESIYNKVGSANTGFEASVSHFGGHSSPQHNPKALFFLPCLRCKEPLEGLNLQVGYLNNVFRKQVSGTKRDEKAF